MAQSSYFSRIFGNSPVSPLQKHIDKVVLCVEQLIPYFDSVIKNDWTQAAKIQTKLVVLENDADQIKNTENVIHASDSVDSFEREFNILSNI